MNSKESLWPQFRLTEPNVGVVIQYVCQTKCCLDNSCKVKSWAWSRWKIPWQRDEVFSGHCGIASQPDGGWPALFTSLSRLTGPGNITNTRNIKVLPSTMWYILRMSLILSYISQLNKWSNFQHQIFTNKKEIVILFTCNRIWHLAGRTQGGTATLERRCHSGLCQWSHLQNKKTCCILIWYMTCKATPQSKVYLRPFVTGCICLRDVSRLIIKGIIPF